MYLDFWPTELWMLFEATKSTVVCYGSNRKLMQPPLWKAMLSNSSWWLPMGTEATQAQAEERLNLAIVKYNLNIPNYFLLHIYVLPAVRQCIEIYINDHSYDSCMLKALLT